MGIVQNKLLRSATVTNRADRELLARIYLLRIDRDDFAVRVSYAHILGSRPTSAAGTGQFWFEVAKFF